jgi:four helix bundle protein
MPGREKAIPSKARIAVSSKQLAVGSTNSTSTLSYERSSHMLHGHRDLRVYQLAYKLAMDIFHLSKSFPREEIYSLTNQVRRSSRSVVANIAEAFRKGRYPNHFVSELTDCDAEATETQVWIDFACDCGYLSEENRTRLTTGYEEVGRMLSSMMEHPSKFAPA